MSLEHLTLLFDDRRVQGIMLNEKSTGPEVVVSVPRQASFSYLSVPGSPSVYVLNLTLVPWVTSFGYGTFSLVFELLFLRFLIYLTRLSCLSSSENFLYIISLLILSYNVEILFLCDILFC